MYPPRVKFLVSLLCVETLPPVYGRLGNNDFPSQRSACVGEGVESSGQMVSYPN